ncbi:hypothetical protein ID80_005100, partial [Salmonella enterica subsp. enterica serovar Ball]|nr:hypothetical protein [Salmonella enterica subsp. enterica serovar Ball]
MRNYTTWREKETGSNCPLQLADKNRLQQSVCCIYVERRNPVMTDAGSIYDVYQPMAWCVLFRSVSGRTLQSERALRATSNGAVCTSFDVAGSQSLFLLRRTLRRQSMVSPVGEYLYSPVKPLSGVPDPASSATSQTVKKSLRTGNGVGYVNYAPHKTGAGRGNPKLSKATQDAESVFFVVRHMCHSMVWCVIRPRSYNRRYIALLAYHTAHDGAMCSYRCAWWTFTTHAPMSTPRRPVMVALAGL